MQATTVREALRASLAGTFGTALSVLPRLIVFAIALAVGWAISSLLARGTSATLTALRFDEMARRSGLARFIQYMGVRQSPTDAVANAAKWLVRLMTLVVALDVLGLPAGSGVLHQLLLWLPNLAVGLVALVIGGVAAAALSRLVRGGATVAGLPNPQVLATATSVAVWAFAIVLAVSQLGIATSVVDLGLVGVVGGMALAAGLAFGWAGRERAAELLALLEERSASLAGRSGFASGAAGAESPVSVSPVSASPVSASPVSASPVSASPRSADIASPLSPRSPADLGSTPALERAAPTVDGIASELDQCGPAPDASVTETEPPPSELDDFDSELDPVAAEFDSAAMEFDPSIPEFDSSAPAFDASASEFNESSAEFDAHAPELELDATVPALHASAPGLEPSPEVLDPFAHQPALFPDHELGLEPARAVAFEESWIPRSAIDRRRIPRPGPDRRASGA